MNSVIAELTLRGLLGRRRAIFLAVLPALLVLLALIIQLVSDAGDQATADLLSIFAMTTLVPLVGLIAGTGAIGPEIDDGSIVYLLAKPISRFTIVYSKFAVAVGVVLVFAAVPTLATGLLLGSGRVAFAFALGAAIAGTAYCALFLALSVIMRNAVVVGLLYAFIWEGIVASVVPGAQAVSIVQWSMAVVERVVGPRAHDLGIDSPTGFVPSIVLLTVLIVGATYLAGRRLQTIRLTSEA